MRFCLGAFLMLALSSSALDGSAETQDAPSVIENVRWDRPPDLGLASNLMPGFANLVGISGSATVRCYVLEDGHPFNCGVIEETTPGVGFGSAARLVVASGQIRTRRIDGAPVPGSMMTTVRFEAFPLGQPFEAWRGANPSEETMALAREFVGRGAEDLPKNDWLDGLDHDRRVVVEPWIEELFPTSPEASRETLVLQVARAFGEDKLRRLKAGEEVTWPTDEEIMAACPEFTPEQEAAAIELRRRYCERYDCDT